MAFSQSLRLRTALYNGESLDQIMTIVEAHPETVLFPGMVGKASALHLACYVDRPLEIVKYLHKKYHEAAPSEIPTVPPFCLAFRHDSDNAVEVVKFLLNSNPNYIGRTVLGEGYLHIFEEFCLNYRGGVRLMNFMIEKYPEATAMTHRSTLGTLLHIRAWSCHPTMMTNGDSTPEQYFGALIEAYPFALLVKDCNGKTPAQICQEVEHRRYLEEREAQVVDLMDALRAELAIIVEHYRIPEAIQEQIWSFSFPNFDPCE